jgi:hypothetical protein
MGTLSVAGNLTVRANGSASGTSKVSSLVIAGTANAWTGRVEINNNALIVETTAGSKAAAIAMLASQVAAGIGGANGITSGTTAADLAHKITVVVDNALLNLTMFGGVAVDANSLLVESTYQGDANLDRRVDVTDLGMLASAYGESVAGGVTQGDFNGDGKVDVTDLGILATEYGVGSGAQAFAATAVPEAGTVGVMMPIISMLMSRTRTKTRQARRTTKPIV